jgi:hypothetical protein
VSAHIVGTARRAVLRRRVRLLVAATITYNVVEAIVALAAATVAGSVALIAFGNPATMGAFYRPSGRAEPTRASGQLSPGSTVASGQRWGEHCRDHISVLDAALAQISDAYRHGLRCWSADTAGCTKAFLDRIRRRRDHRVAREFSVGWAITDRQRAAIARIPAQAWTATIDAAGDVGDLDEALVAELTGPAHRARWLSRKHAHHRALRMSATWCPPGVVLGRVERRSRSGGSCRRLLGVRGRRVLRGSGGGPQEGFDRSESRKSEVTTLVMSFGTLQEQHGNFVAQHGDFRVV